MALLIFSFASQPSLYDASAFIARYCYQMRTLFVAFIMLVAVTGAADDLGTLETAAKRHVASMKAVLVLPDAPD